MVSRFPEQADLYASLLREMQNYLAGFSRHILLPEMARRGDFPYLHSVPQTLAVQEQIEKCQATACRRSLLLVRTIHAVWDFCLYIRSGRVRAPYAAISIMAART